MQTTCHARRRAPPGLVTPGCDGWGPRPLGAPHPKAGEKPRGGAVPSPPPTGSRCRFRGAFVHFPLNGRPREVRAKSPRPGRSRGKGPVILAAPRPAIAGPHRAFIPLQQTKQNATKRCQLDGGTHAEAHEEDLPLDADRNPLDGRRDHPWLSPAALEEKGRKRRKTGSPRLPRPFASPGPALLLVLCPAAGAAEPMNATPRPALEHGAGRGFLCGRGTGALLVTLADAHHEQRDRHGEARAAEDPIGRHAVDVTCLFRPSGP